MAALGIPYMGSKRKLAGNILQVITARHPHMSDFYDLFGGGGSVSFTAIRDYRFNVHYNELNSHIFYLVKYLKENKTLQPKFYEWVTRDEFFRQLARTDADWYSGFVMTCWSFGNNSEKGYLYGSDIEEIKRHAHNFIVFGALNSMRLLGINLPELSNIKDVQQRRIYFCDYIKKGGSNLEDNRVQNIELVEHLARIQNLQNLQNLQITNLSYEKVNIQGHDPVIYCDIPYRGTGEYKESGFNHDDFYQWASDCSYPVYVSEYDSPLIQVDAFKHRSSLSATNNRRKTIEKIFWNGKGNIAQQKLFV